MVCRRLMAFFLFPPILHDDKIFLSALDRLNTCKYIKFDLKAGLLDVVAGIYARSYSKNI